MSRRTRPESAPAVTFPVPEGYVQRTVTRASKSYLAIITPEEFFAGDALAKLMSDLAGRYVRCAKFLRRDDVAQDAALQVLESARRWTPAWGVPFGGYAYRNAMMWLIGAMHRASVPVSGADSRAAVESIRWSSFEQPRSSSHDGEATTLGAILGWEDTDTGETHRPDDAMARDRLYGAVAAESAAYPAEVADLLLAILHGATIEPSEAPAGYTVAGLRREAEKFRSALAYRLREGEHTAHVLPAPELHPDESASDADPFAGAWA